MATADAFRQIAIVVGKLDARVSSLEKTGDQQSSTSAALEQLERRLTERVSEETVLIQASVSMTVDEAVSRASINREATFERRLRELETSLQEARIESASRVSELERTIREISEAKASPPTDITENPGV